MVFEVPADGDVHALVTARGKEKIQVIGREIDVSGK